MTNKEIKKLCRSFGADLVGVASVERFVNAPKGYHPTNVMPTAKSVISLGMVLPKDILEQDYEHIRIYVQRLIYTITSNKKDGHKWRRISHRVFTGPISRFGYKTS